MIQKLPAKYDTKTDIKYNEDEYFAHTTLNYLGSSGVFFDEKFLSTGDCLSSEPLAFSQLPRNSI